MNEYRHTAMVTTAVHDQLIGWARDLLHDADLEIVDVYGRFPPEGTTRSHLVMFPYRVGPDPKMMDFSKPVSLFRSPRRREHRGPNVPVEWSDLGGTMSKYFEQMYPQIEPYDPKHAHRGDSPYPLVENLPEPLAAWYGGKEPQDDGEGWVLDIGGRRARPPSLMWRPGIHISAFYIALASDPGRGTSSRTSDTAPLALAALSVLSVGIQTQRTIKVRLPHRAVPDDFFAFVAAFADGLEALDLGDEAAEDADRLRQLNDIVGGDSLGDFMIQPVHDLNNQEFALLTQALQRPLQAILNIRLRIPVGAGPQFAPSSQVFVQSRKGERGGSSGR